MLYTRFHARGGPAPAFGSNISNRTVIFFDCDFQNDFFKDQIRGKPPCRVAFRTVRHGAAYPTALLIVVSQSLGLRYRTRPSARRWKRLPVCTIHPIASFVLLSTCGTRPMWALQSPLLSPRNSVTPCGMAKKPHSQPPIKGGMTMGGNLCYNGIAD